MCYAPRGVLQLWQLQQDQGVATDEHEQAFRNKPEVDGKTRL